AAGQIEQWYGPQRPNHFSSTFLRADSLGPRTIPELQSIIADTAYNDLVRATSAWYLGQFRTRESLDILEGFIHDPSPLVRNSVARALAAFPPEMKRLPLQDALDDSIRSVRLAAAEGLSEFSVQDIAFHLKEAFQTAIEEYETYLATNQYFPRGQMNLGQYYEKRGEVDRAMEAYRKAIEKDNHFNAARINLAYLYNQRGENQEAERLLQTVIGQEPSYGPAHYSLALLLAEMNRIADALPHFEQAASLMPNHHRVRYNWAISLQRLNRPEDAEQAYLEAIRIAPENPDYRYGICTLYIQQQQFAQARTHVQQLIDLDPDNQRYRQLENMIRERLNN
ncbi:MAG: tetratricopeptide repeat protein, partial [Balneolaceae bacterium]|nr:tetratricopeptide repeat protein [Balneolaceae bacterium]